VPGGRVIQTSTQPKRKRHQKRGSKLLYWLLH
jgi:hypothetical protein